MDDHDEIPIPTKLLRLGMSLASILAVLLVIGLILKIGNCYGWVPHGPWYPEEPAAPEQTHEEWLRARFEDCLATCRQKTATGEGYGKCVLACKTAYGLEPDKDSQEKQDEKDGP